jgi:hypothetical protein
LTSTDCPKLCFQRAPTSGAGTVSGAVLVDGHTSVLPQVNLHCRRRAGSVSVMRGTGACDEEGRRSGSGGGASAAYRSPLVAPRSGGSEKFRAVGERENPTFSKTKGAGRTSRPSLRDRTGHSPTGRQLPSDLRLARQRLSNSYRSLSR